MKLVLNYQREQTQHLLHRHHLLHHLTFYLGAVAQQCVFEQPA